MQIRDAGQPADTALAQPAVLVPMTIDRCDLGIERRDVTADVTHQRHVLPIRGDELGADTGSQRRQGTPERRSGPLGGGFGPQQRRQMVASGPAVHGEDRSQGNGLPGVDPDAPPLDRHLRWSEELDVEQAVPPLAYVSPT